ncbi:MAG: CotH kinase family protein [Phycisphaerales bacterium]
MRSIAAPALLAACALAVSAHSLCAQDLYDTTVLRTMNFQFRDANWEALLRANYAAQVNILADLTVDGITYPSVGVRLRGNTSYTALPAGSQKFSLNVELDAVDPEQDLYGFSSLNLNNGFHDPTFCREVLYNNYVAQFIPNPRANHVLVTLNGQNWGVYINVQQFNKTMLSSHFPDTTGLRIKCANNPNGPGLRYNGAAASGYTGYEIKDPGGFTDPFVPHIAVCNALTNGVVANWQTSIDPLFAVDPSIWSVVFENILTDDDSYVNKGADFMTYRNPTDGRTYLLQTDANETFTQTTWAFNRNFTQTTKPVLNRVLSVAELRQRYLAHYRTTLADLNWAYFGPRAAALRTLIEPHVQADPKKLYTFANFQNNFTASVTLPFAGPAGGTVPGLQPFVEQRFTFLNTGEVAAPGPTISSVVASDSSPDPADPVSITAAIAANGSSVSRADLWYRAAPTGRYLRVQMTSAGNGLYTAPLPVAGAAGQRVAYYVSATSANAFSSLAFFPKRTEWDPQVVEYTFGASGGMRVTEWMYSGPSGEFIEFTNLSAAPIDMSGWSFDDDHAVPGAFPLTAFGVVQPGESVLLTEADPTAFRTAWGLPASVKVIGALGAVGVGGNNLARNDEINLYNSSGTLVDRLTYGDQSFPGTVRAQNNSGQTCRETIGQDSIVGWVRSSAMDVYGSFASAAAELGTPGMFSVPFCNGCVVPSVGTAPAAQSACPGGEVGATVVAAGTGPLAYQWQIESAPLGSGSFTDLEDGLIAGLGTVTGVDSASIMIESLSATTSGVNIRCVITNGCGSIASEAAIISAMGGVACCPLDFNHDGIVEPGDLDEFITAFFSDVDVERDLCDFNGDGIVEPGDLDEFITLYFEGC